MLHKEMCACCVQRLRWGVGGCEWLKNQGTLFLPTVISIHHRCTYTTCNTHGIPISCSKQEVKNNISHCNLGSGETGFTGVGDYRSIFNKVKDLQWCMWLPFQSRRSCHLLWPATSGDDDEWWWGTGKENKRLKKIQFKLTTRLNLF